MEDDNRTNSHVRIAVRKGMLIPKHGHECVEYYKDVSITGNFCKAEFDNFVCWPPGHPGTNISHQCPRISSIGGHILGYTKITEAYATRICDINGQWYNRTDYSRCLEHIEELYDDNALQNLVAYIIFIGAILSLATLAISLFIFYYFKSLRNFQLKVHRNLCVALFIHLLLLFILSAQNIFDISHYTINWLCKTMLGFQMYSSMSSINWMFLEGLYLHNKVAFTIFRQDAHHKLYYFIGWGLPALLVGAWCGMMEVYHKIHCWKYFSESHFIYLIIIPIATALLINLLFLINIIRVLVTKHSGNPSMERMQIRQAIKTTIFLFPLLGITHLIFCFNPTDSEEINTAFIIGNSVIQSSQGLFVGILYCFMNHDVKKALKNAYARFNITRNPKRVPQAGLISQASYLSHSEDLLSHCSLKQMDTNVVLKHPDDQLQMHVTTSQLSMETKICNTCKDGSDNSKELNDDSVIM